MVIQVCQLLSFPFALDVDKDTLALIMEAVRDTQIPAQLLQVLSWPYVPPSPHTVVIPSYIAVSNAWHHFTSCWQHTRMSFGCYAALGEAGLAAKLALTCWLPSAAVWLTSCVSTVHSAVLSVLLP